MKIKTCSVIVALVLVAQARLPAGVDKSVACRYAFCGKPTVNLVNRDDLPAYTFRTDDWDQ